MKKFISISRNPGSLGSYYYNEFFKHMGIDAVYEARKTNDLNRAIEQAVLEGVEGVSVSQPFKRAVISYLDHSSDPVAVYNTCNTIKLEQGRLVGYNTDLAGVEYTVEEIAQQGLTTVSILGLGAMGTMYKDYLTDNNYSPRVFARSLDTWQDRHAAVEVIVNTTSSGTNPLDRMPEGVKLVIDLAIQPSQLELECMNEGIKYIGGHDFYRQQFLNQFEIYTGQPADPELFNQLTKKYEQI